MPWPASWGANEWAALGQCVGAVATTLAIIWGFMGVKRQMWLASFCEFTRRYADFVDRLPEPARVPDSDRPPVELTNDERVRLRSAMRLYLNLCSEEHYLHRQGILDTRTWSIWEQGIRDMLRSRCVREAWSGLRAEYESYPEFCEFMDASVGSWNATPRPAVALGDPGQLVRRPDPIAPGDRLIPD